MRFFRKIWLKPPQQKNKMAEMVDIGKIFLFTKMAFLSCIKERPLNKYKCNKL